MKFVAAESDAGVLVAGVADADVAEGAAEVTGGCGEGAVQPASKIAATPRAKIRLRIRQMIGSLGEDAYGVSPVSRDLQAKQNPAFVAMSH